MTSLIRTCIVALAMLTAMVLLLFGVREIRAGRGRHGLFVTTLLGALGLAACGGAAKTRSPVDPPPAQAAQGAAVDAQATSQRMAELAQTPQWIDFKALWKRLDAVEPTKPGDEAYIGEYYGALTYEQAQGLREELDAVIAGLRKPGMKKLVSDLEVDLLATICSKRIDYLEFGLQSMMTRMVQPPMKIEMESSIGDLERHIDVLVDLRQRGKISSDEFETALAVVEDDIKAYAVLDTLGSIFMGYYLPIFPGVVEKTPGGSFVSAAEASIAAFEESYASFKGGGGASSQAGDANKELEAQYEKAKKAIDELEPLLPSIGELVEDLER